MNEQREQLDPRLENAIKQLKTVPPRSAAVAARGRARFLAEVQELPRREGLLALLTQRTSFAMASAIVLVLLVVVGGTGATAYAAEASLPDSPLYPVKMFTEDARISLAFQPESRLDLYLAFADRRLNEIAAVGNQVALPDVVTNRMEDELDQALVIAMELPDSERPKALEKLQNRIQKQSQKVTELQAHSAIVEQGAVKRVNEALQEQMQLIDMGKADPPGLKKKMQDSPKKGEPRATVTSPVPDNQQKQTTPPGQEHKQNPDPKNPGDDKGNPADKGNKGSPGNNGNGGKHE